jgi:hypothetical protein
MFRPGRGSWLTIGQLSKAFVCAHRVRHFAVPVTNTDLDVLRFVFTCGAPEGGRHRWRAYGATPTLVRSLSDRMILDPAHVRTSLRRLQDLGLLDVHELEVWTTQQMHLIGAELLWCDLLERSGARLVHGDEGRRPLLHGDEVGPVEGSRPPRGDAAGSCRSTTPLYF